MEGPEASLTPASISSKITRGLVRQTDFRPTGQRPANTTGANPGDL
jgi:hypothetical protein